MQVLKAITDNKWAITEGGLNTIIEIANRNGNVEAFGEETRQALTKHPRNGGPGWSRHLASFWAVVQIC